MKKSIKAFTLVELMVGMSIFLCMMGIVMLVVSTAQTTYFEADARVTAQQDIRKALQPIFRELSESRKTKIHIPEPSRIVFQMPIKVIDGGSLHNKTVDSNNNILFGARLLPKIEPDGIIDYAVEYYLVPNNDISNTNKLVRRVLNAFPNGSQVGDGVVLANYIESIEFVHTSFPPTYSATDDMVTICHVSPGNSNRRTITVSKNALSAHLAHGDTLGRCFGDSAPVLTDSNYLVILVSAAKNSKFGRHVSIPLKFSILLRN